LSRAVRAEFPPEAIFLTVLAIVARSAKALYILAVEPRSAVAYRLYVVGYLGGGYPSRSQALRA